MDRSKVYHMQIADATRPMSGQVIVDAFWCVLPGRGIAFWDSGRRKAPNDARPQCNSDERVSSRLAKIHPGHVVEKIPMVFLSNLSRVKAE